MYFCHSSVLFQVRVSYRCSSQSNMLYLHLLFIIHWSLCTDLWWNAVIWVWAVRALSINAHLEQLVDGGIHSSIVGAQHTLYHLIIHRGEHSLEVLHGLVELQASDLPVGSTVIELPLSTATPTAASTASGASIAAAAASEQASHPQSWACLRCCQPADRMVPLFISNASTLGPSILLALLLPCTVYDSNTNLAKIWVFTGIFPYIGHYWFTSGMAKYIKKWKGTGLVRWWQKLKFAMSCHRVKIGLKTHQGACIAAS